MAGKYIVVICFALGLTGCSISQKTATEAEADQGNILIVPQQQTSKPVLALIARARTASRQGNLGQARADIERAIRIEPRNPVLWHYLGKLSLQQSRYREAINLALKSNQLAKDNKLRSDNWRLVAHARYQLGDRKGAQRAQFRARALLD